MKRSDNKVRNKNMSLIAKFLGAIKIFHQEYFGKRFYYVFQEAMGEDIQVEDFGDSYSTVSVYDFAPEDMKFDTDWNWIMKVIEKIESLYLSFQISENNVFIHWMGAEPEDESLHTILKKFKGIDVDGNSKKEAVFNSIVEFIEWYNLEKKNEKI